MSKKRVPVDWAKRVADEMARYIEENDTLPWLRPWNINGIFPSNLQTKHTYTGINAMLLGMYMGFRSYETPYFLTMNGMKALGGSFKDWDGEAHDKGLPIVFWKMIRVEDKDTGKDKTVPLLRGWTVWNVAHMENIELPPLPEPAFVDVPEAVAGMESRYPNAPRIEHEPSAQAYYSPLFDRVTLPLQSQFTSIEGYAETKAHELVHSTGHRTRLARFDDNANPHEAYAREELVAEIGAAIMMQKCGLEPQMQRMADYVRGWGTRIKDDPKMLISAANKADKAVSLILGEVHEEQEVAA